MITKPPTLATGASSYAAEMGVNPRFLLSYVGQAYEVAAQIRALNDMLRGFEPLEAIVSQYAEIAEESPVVLAAALQDANCIEERLHENAMEFLHDRVVTVGVSDALALCSGVVDVVLALTDPSIPLGYFTAGDDSESNEAINRLNRLMSALRCPVSRDILRSVASTAGGVVQAAKEIPGVSGAPCPPVERIQACREEVEGTLRSLAEKTGMPDWALVNALEHLHDMVGALEEATRPSAEHGSILHLRHAMTHGTRWATGEPGTAFNAAVDARARGNSRRATLGTLPRSSVSEMLRSQRAIACARMCWRWRRRRRNSRGRSRRHPRTFSC